MPRTLNVESILAAAESIPDTTGYAQEQNQRREVFDEAKRMWRAWRSSDCSFMVFAVMLVAGLTVSAWRKITLFSGNLVKVLVATGLFREIDVSRYDTLGELTAALQPADAMTGPGHAILVGRGGKRWLSWRNNELGKSTGGRKGRQKGEAVGWVAPYMRSRGWTRVARLIPAAEFLGRILAAYAKGKSWAKPLALFGVRAPSDVKLWRIFLAEMERFTKGVQPDYKPRVVSDSGHAYVVLGGTIAQMKQRLTVALAGLQLNPKSLVIVTGGVVRQGKSEAVWMRDWLLANGVAADRIVTETKASSTVGNARYSLPLLIARKITSATLVSFDSHVRRGQILMLAAQLAIETAGAGIHPTGITWTTPLAYPDKQVAKTKASAATRATIAAHTAAVLGLTKQYQAAL
ncbi:DUF218 domain-containing protein [Propionicimonas paludicola]|uniref:DUF218 domain-containing protein n=1 Tax=Propionicimonas paludicola TaxID=185243 RepID=A0A2A9CPJ5_9ACTN|nr:YdcF family protein [Propionicimonas paludicola]PFG16268.1 DUF218 domain-containing protein [Propionicimonas paludicola]